MSEPKIYKPSIYNGNGVYNNGAGGGGANPLDIIYETDFENFDTVNKYDIPQKGWVSRYPIKANYSLNNGLVVSSNTLIEESFLSFYIKDGSRFKVNICIEESINYNSNFFWFLHEIGLKVNNYLGNNIYIAAKPEVNVITNLPSILDAGLVHYNTGATAGNFYDIEFVCNNGQILVYLENNLILTFTEDYTSKLFLCLFAPQQNKNISCTYLKYTP